MKEGYKDDIFRCPACNAWFLFFPDIFYCTSCDFIITMYDGATLEDAIAMSEAISDAYLMRKPKVAKASQPK